MRVSRRQMLAQLGMPALAMAAWPHGAMGASGTSKATASTRLVAAWQAGSGPQVGVLEAMGTELRVAAALDVPTRPHGLAVAPDGSLLAVARRPGDWLLRWDARGRAIAWAWAEADRAFNGHVLCAPDGRTLYTTETDLATGQGLVGVRNALSLAKQDEWPTHGMDPHALVWDAHAAQGERLVVANGGLETRPETGRLKINRDRMDSSLVRLDARTGALAGQWRVDDRRLSLRHLAWHGHGPKAMLGIAMQAEHEDAERRAAAPVLALFDGEHLAVAGMARPLAGYGGDIAATPQGFAVSCPRVHGVARWNARGQALSFVALAEACALSAGERGLADELWVGGHPAAVHLQGDSTIVPCPLHADLRLDNHWVRLPTA
jgi:hypothetical protein